MLDVIGRDVRHAMRGLSRNPGYALVFIVTLGLNIIALHVVRTYREQYE